jgi:hypothetical protein
LRHRRRLHVRHLWHAHLRHSGHLSGWRRRAWGSRRRGRRREIRGNGHHSGVLARTLRRGGGRVCGRRPERLCGAATRTVRRRRCGRWRGPRLRRLGRRRPGQRSGAEHACVLAEFLLGRRSGCRRRLGKLRHRWELRPRRHAGRRFEKLRELAPFGRRGPGWRRWGRRRLKHPREGARLRRLGSRRRPVSLGRYIGHRRLEHAGELVWSRRCRGSS